MTKKSVFTRAEFRENENQSLNVENGWRKCEKKGGKGWSRGRLWFESIDKSNKFDIWF